MKLKIGSLGLFRNVIANLCIVLIVLTLGVYALGSASVAASASPAPIYKGNSRSKVSLMINVYWGTEFLDEMLETLAAHNVKTTFFLGGTWVRDNEDKAKAIVANGHEIGNHGFFHKDHKKISAERNKEEITSTHNLVKSVLAKEMTLFMPPSGSFSAITLEIARDLGYTTVMWSKDTIDWRDSDVKLIVKRATKNVEGGDLILMHPTAATAKALPEIIDAIIAKGLSIAPVTEVINYTGENNA